MSVRRQVFVSGGLGYLCIMVTKEATGKAIKAEAKRLPALSHIGMNWQLLGHNRNGSSSVIGDEDSPWQDTFEIRDIRESA